MIGTKTKENTIGVIKEDHFDEAIDKINTNNVIKNINDARETYIE